MNDPMPSLSPDLLHHEPYLRGLLRALLRDESSVDDVLQETWIRALARPAEGLAGGRPWLSRVARNLASDKRRSGGRRARREHEAARPEALSSASDAAKRYEARERVIDAVLELQEPYRAVVLLTYFEQRSCAEIAKQTGVAESTVRAQLTRARAMLRSKLDAEFGGDRERWAALALPAARLGWPLRAAGVVLLTGGAAWGVTAALGGGAATQASSPAELSAPAAPEPARALAAVTETAARVFEPTPVVRVPSAAGEPGSDVEADEGAELSAARDRAVQIQRELERRYRTPVPGLQAEYAAWIAESPDTRGSAVLADTDGVTMRSTVSGRVISRGDLGYYSFHTGEASYDAEPAIGLSGGVLRAGFHGGQAGVVCELADLDPFELDPLVPPAGDDDWLDDWHFFTDGVPDSRDEGLGFLETLRGSKIGRRADARLGAGYLLRNVALAEHDCLVAFRVVGLEFSGVTIAFDVLRDRDLVDPQRPNQRFRQYFAEVPQGPSELKEFSEAELLQELAQLRTEQGGRLIEITEEDLAAVEESLGSVQLGRPPAGGVFRLAERFTWSSLSHLPAGGPCYYAFGTGEFGWCNETSIGYEQGKLSGAGSGDWMVSLGPLELAQRAAAFRGEFPGDLSADADEAVELLRTVESSLVDGQPRVPEEQLARADELLLRYGIPAREGSTFLFRSPTDSTDRLAVLQIVRRDTRGVLIAWRTLDVFRE